MFKKLLLSLIILNLTIFGAACTSGGTEEEGAAAEETAAAEGGEGAESAESDSAEEGTETAASEDEGDAEDSENKVGEDAAGEDDLGDEIADNTSEEKDEEGVADLDDEDLGEEVAKTEPEEKKSEEPAPPAADEPPTDVAKSDEPVPAPVMDVAPTPGNIPLQKVKTAPFKKGDVLANTVYIGRPEDTVEGVSQKLFGADKSSELIAVNGFLKRGVKAGDKIYYNSPKRPTDETQMLTYFEDIGAVPAEYEAKDGENIRKISKQLLGFEDAWKEVWSTNPMVESKAELAGGTKIRYWTNESVMAAAAPPPTPQPVEPPVAVAPPPPDIPPPPADVPVPPPSAATSSGSNGNMPPPEPMVEPPAPPPPPVVMNEPKAKPASEFSLAGLMENKDTMTIIIGGAVVVIGLLVILAMARKRRTRIDFGQTQV